MASKEASSVEQKLWYYVYKITSPELAQVFKSPSSPERRARKIPKIFKIGAWDDIWELENSTSPRRLPQPKLETMAWIAQSRGQLRMGLESQNVSVHVSAEVKARGYGQRRLNYLKATASMLRDQTTDTSVTHFGTAKGWLLLRPQARARCPFSHDSTIP